MHAAALGTRSDTSGYNNAIEPTVMPGQAGPPWRRRRGKNALGECLRS